MTQFASRGFSLVEVVIVVALLGLALTLAGPRIGAGLGRLELNQAEQSVRAFVKLARVQALRTDREHYVVLDRERESITLLDPDMKPLRQKKIPASVQVVVDSGGNLASISVPPSGIVRDKPVRLRGRSGQAEISFQ